jgi:type VI protein secretion system component Hcp
MSMSTHQSHFIMGATVVTTGQQRTLVEYVTYRKQAKAQLDYLIQTFTNVRMCSNG